MTRRAPAAALVIVTAAVMAYARTLDNYFVQDDFGVVWLLSQKPASYFPTWFVTSWMDTIWGFTPDEVRPFVAVTYQLAALAGPATPWPNHALNIAFHAASGLLVFDVGRRAAFLSVPAAALAGLIFVLLPNQADTAAWITGRVDSAPALFYLAAFLAWVRWRREGYLSSYLWSIVWCFVALFAKQNTITLVPALLLFDAVVIKGPPPWRAYIPHATLTAGYLVLRYVLFGEVAREGQLTADRFGYFAADAIDHLQRLVLGSASPSDLIVGSVAAALVAIGATAFVVRSHSVSDRDPTSLLLRNAIYFGPVWIGLGLLPTLMSTYSSTRHAYLAAAGWAILIGIGIQAAVRSNRRQPRAIAMAATAVLLVAYAVQLRALVLEWDVRADVARRATTGLAREAVAHPPGALIIVGAPASSFGFSLPFAAKPPFVDHDLTSHARLVFHSSLYCCPAEMWEAYTRDALAAWLADRSQPPAVALYWNAGTGRLSRVSSHDDPAFATLVRLASETRTRAALDGAITQLLEEFVALHHADTNR